jgi:hypothetical protein
VGHRLPRTRLDLGLRRAGVHRVNVGRIDQTEHAVRLQVAVIERAPRRHAFGIGTLVTPEMERRNLGLDRRRRSAVAARSSAAAHPPDRLAPRGAAIRNSK